MGTPCQETKMKLIHTAAGLAVLGFAIGGLSFTGVTFGAAPAASARAHDDWPQPGYWETTSKLTLSKTKVERRCFVASEINKFLTNPENRHYACT